MQSTSPYVPTHARPRDREVIRHRVRTRLTGRGRLVVPAAVLLLGLPIAAVSAAVSGGEPEPATTLAVAAGQQERADAAQRADRGDRSVAPSPSASTPAQAKAATPEAKKQEAAPAPKATTAKPQATTAKPQATPAWVTPMPGGEITSCFGQRWGVLHAGIDLAADEGTPIHAAASGTVLAAGWVYAGYGISVMIDHGSGVQTHYAHQSRTVVQPGQKVKAGQVIGYEGSTGDSTGPHLHFEVHQGLWNQINPAPFLRARGVNLGC